MVPGPEDLRAQSGSVKDGAGSINIVLIDRQMISWSESVSWCGLFGAFPFVPQQSKFAGKWLLLETLVGIFRDNMHSGTALRSNKLAQSFVVTKKILGFPVGSVPKPYII